MNSLPTTSQLYLFVIYSECCDIAKAAAKANILINDFNIQIRELELLVGTKLIIRGERESQLTEDGILFAKEAKAILDHLENASLKFRHEMAKEATVINVGSLLTMGDILLDQDILYFENLHPDIKLQIYNHEATDLCKLIENNELDLAVLFDFDHLNLNLDNYEHVPYITEPLVYYAPNLNSLRQNISLEDLTDYPLVEYPPHFVMNNIVRQYVKSHNLELNTIAWFTSPYAIINYCQQYLVGSFQCERLLNQFGFYEGYYHVTQELNISYSLFYHKHSKKKEAIQTFLSYLREKHNF